MHCTLGLIRFSLQYDYLLASHHLCQTLSLFLSLSPLRPRPPNRIKFCCYTPIFMIAHTHTNTNELFTGKTFDCGSDATSSVVAATEASSIRIATIGNVPDCSTDKASSVGAAMPSSVATATEASSERTATIGNVSATLRIKHRRVKAAM